MIVNAFEKPSEPVVERRQDARYPSVHFCNQCGEMEVDTVSISLIAGTSEGNFWTSTSICEGCVQDLLERFQEAKMKENKEKAL